MTWGFQAVIKLAPSRRVSGDIHQVWRLPGTVGEVRLSGAGENLIENSDLTFRAGGYASPAEAQAAGESFHDWLRLASALEGWGFAVGEQVECLGAPVEDSVMPKGVLRLPDVHGLVFYEETGTPMRLSGRAAGMVLWSGDTIRDALVRTASSARLGKKLALACDLVSLVEHESSDRARLLNLVAAMEVLANRKPRTGRVRKLVEGFIEEARAALNMPTVAAEQRQIESLQGALEGLRRISISASVRDLAARARPSDQAAARDLVTRTYACRSEMLHDGYSTEDPGRLHGEVLALVQDMIRVLLVSDHSDTEGASR
jgi:hypothetical protein